MQSYRQSCQLYLLMFLSMLDHVSILPNIVVLNNWLNLFEFIGNMSSFLYYHFPLWTASKLQKWGNRRNFYNYFRKDCILRDETCLCWPPWGALPNLLRKGWWFHSQYPLKRRWTQRMNWFDLFHKFDNRGTQYFILSVKIY